jgi:hypothetical protein
MALLYIKIYTIILGQGFKYVALYNILKNLKYIKIEYYLWQGPGNERVLEYGNILIK